MSESEKWERELTEGKIVELIGISRDKTPMRIKAEVTHRAFNGYINLEGNGKFYVLCTVPGHLFRDWQETPKETQNLRETYVGTVRRYNIIGNSLPSKD
jgi:hypothetical protein